MKLKYLSIIPILLVSSCVAQVGVDYNTEKYTNVAYSFVRGDNYYNVKYAYDETTIKECHVSPSNVYYVYFDNYVYDENERIIYNEFYVKGTNYSLYVYKKQ